MKNFIATKYILLYLMAGVVFYFIFKSVEPYYIINHYVMPHPIDAHVLEGRAFFDAKYIHLAKIGGYNHAHYYQSFFLLDLVFPLVYTLLFLSIGEFLKDSKLYPVVRFLIVAGCIFDYLENFSFALYLQTDSPSFVLVVAFFSTIKSILFGINLIVAVLCLLWRLLIRLKLIPAWRKTI